MSTRRVRSWVLLKSLIPGPLPADDELVELRAAGADVTRNSRSEWVANPHDPLVREWCRKLGAAAP